MKRIILSFVALMLVTTSWAQGFLYTVSGSVTDSNGAPIANEPVVIVDSLSQPPIFAIAVTDAQGNYSANLQGPLQLVVVAVNDCNG